MQSPAEVLQQMEHEEKREAVDPPTEEVPKITRLKINVVGSRGRRYQGEFVYKVPNLGEQRDIGRLKAFYLPQGCVADPNAALIVEQVCYLQVTLKDPKPEWFPNDPFELYDATPLSALYGEALKYERWFHGANEERDEARSGDSNASSAEPTGSETDGEPRMGRKVQPTTQRRETIVAHSSRGG